MSNEKRLQQIRDAARYKYPDERIHFIDGAKWADSHPAWVSVEDELPKVDEQTTLSNECVVVDSSGARYFGYYNGTDECWYTDDYTMILFVTHWMQLPQPPVKKGGEE